jgi:hypothetical protein
LTSPGIVVTAHPSSQPTFARFSSGVGFSRKTAKVVLGWPELGRAERYVIRKPQP